MEMFEQESNIYTHVNKNDLATSRKNFMVKAYSFMASGLIVTFAVALIVALAFSHLAQNVTIVIGVAVAEILVALVFAFAFKKLNVSVLCVLFYFYSILTGASMGAVLVYFELSTVLACFAITAVLFILMSVFGAHTSWDMRGYGRYVLFALIGMLVMTVLNLIFQFGWLQVFICCIGIALFMGITAYDTQKLYDFHDAEYSGQTDRYITGSKLCLMGAFQLYLDFINIFYYLLRLLAIIQDRS